MSVNSKTDICNMALDLLGAGIVTNVDNPSTPTEELMDRWYDQSRIKVLRTHPWNFATKRAILAASSTVPAFGFEGQFPVPPDFVRVNYLSGTEGNIIDTNLYRVEGKNILYNADAGQLNLLYVYNFTDVLNMDALFIDALAHEIALACAYKVTENNTNVQRLEELRKQRESLAKIINGQESPPRRREVSRAKIARRQTSYTVTNRTIF